MKILFVLNSVSFFISHRLLIARKLLRDGNQVHILCPLGSATEQEILRKAGIVSHAWSYNRSGTHVLSDLWSCIELHRTIRKVSPDIVHLVTMKVILLGGLVRHSFPNTGFLFAVSGLGTLFLDQSYRGSIRRLITKPFMRIAFTGKNIAIVFQNKDDQKDLSSWLSINLDGSAHHIRGSGVDLDQFRLVPEPGGPIKVVFVGRLLRDKGIFEFVEAVHLLRQAKLNAKFLLAGAVDPGNKSSLSTASLDRLIKSGVVENLGFVTDIAELLQSVNLVVLPSYREGLPLALIEAAASGRAIVTTDTAGCRDSIIDGESGFLVPVKDSKSLAEKIRLLIENELLRSRFGFNGRKLAEKEFGQEKVIFAHEKIYSDLLKKVSLEVES